MPHIGDRFAINTYAYTQARSATDTVTHLAGLGVGAFELMFYPGHLWLDDSPRVRKELRQAVDGADGRVVSVNTPNIDLNVAAASAEMREHSLAINEAYLRIAGELGAPALVLGPGKANPLFPLPRETLLGHFRAALDRLLPVAGSCGVDIWVENQPFAFVPDAAGLLDAVAGYEGVGICYDVANAHFIGEDPLEGMARIGNRLALIHISDTTRAAYRTIPSVTATSISPGWQTRSALPRRACRPCWRSSAPSRTQASRARRRACVQRATRPLQVFH